MSKWAYYNEIDPFVADWLRNLMTAGLVAPGEVDERDVREVCPDELKGFQQVHLFAGIGGWSCALRLAGWPDCRPVWTASCPCPPFSVAGKQQECAECKSLMLVWCPRRTGTAICAACGHAWLADSRHLWPEVWRLSAIRRPERIFGEQVASLTGLEWLAGLRASMEIIHYAVGATDLPAIGAQAPHLRQRIWFVADADQVGHEKLQRGVHPEIFRGREGRRPPHGLEHGGPTGALADSHGVPEGPVAGGSGQGIESQAGGSSAEARRYREAGDLADALWDAPGRYAAREARGIQTEGQSDDAREHRGALDMDDADRAGPQGHARRDHPYQWNPWATSDVVPMLDGKFRSVEPGTFPMANGVPARVGRTCAYGNAIVPQVAGRFIQQYAEGKGLR